MKTIKMYEPNKIAQKCVKMRKNVTKLAKICTEKTCTNMSKIVQNFAQNCVQNQNQKISTGVRN